MSPAYIPAGVGFNVGQDFARAMADTPIRLAPKEYARPGYVIGYIDPWPDSRLGFMRHGGKEGVRVHVRRELLREVTP